MSVPPDRTNTSLWGRLAHFLSGQDTCALSSSPSETNPHLYLARERIANSMIRIAALVGIFILCLTLPLFIGYGQVGVGLIYTATVVVLWVLALWRRLRPRLHITLFVLLFYLLGLSEMLNYGYSIEGYIYFFVFVISGSLFRSPRAGWLAFCLSLLTMVVLGLLVASGTFAPLSLEPEKINYSYDSWFVSWLVFTLMSVVVGSSTNQLIKSLDLAWQSASQAMSALQNERDQLEMRVQERTQALATARDQALSANHYKSELMARISHELRTPLGVILGYAEIMEKGGPGPLTEKQTKMLKSIVESSNHLTELINDLLDQSYIESGKLEITQRLFPLEALYEHALGFRSKAASKGLAFNVQVDPALPGTLFGDEKRVRQILNNLIGNALKFTEHGEVRVRLALISPKEWLIEVQDTGPGIPLEAQTRIFEPFWQLDTSITRLKDGHGLGLALVKQTSELLGGQVSLQSTPGQGSIFRVSLPLRTREK